MVSQGSVVIAGAGIFGLSAALELHSRGYAVTVVDPGPVPHPLAASNDVSRMVRMDYADDKLYSDLAAEAIEGWHEWNDRRGRPLYHEDGFLVLTSHPLEGGVVGSLSTCNGSGVALERLTPLCRERFRCWNAGTLQLRLLQPGGGWAEPGNGVVSWRRRSRAPASSAFRSFRPRRC